ncbi:MAG: DUF2207 domain-containing protein [Candidatus Rokubacteria bacterium]|nr:DUF2207 domain-containing protein [Candidatus Rokubacteria bacterium]
MNPDATLVVREDIAFEFRGSHNGVFRTIPVRYDRGGYEFALRLDGIGAYDEAGQPLRHEVSYPGRYVKIKAWVPGAQDTTKTVTFVYRVRRGILRFEDHDELYWNATGNEWEVPIRHAEVFVNTPPGVADAAVRSIAYTGLRGGTGQDYTLDRVEKYLRFSATRPFRPREGLTVVVGWPPGHIGRPSALQQATWFFSDNWPFGLPLLAAALGWFVWWAYGRDPAAHRSVKPEYEPPEGLIPAEAGTLVDEKAEPREVLATIVDLAVRGYLHVEQITTAFGAPDFMFKRLKPVGGDPNLKQLELYILAKLFSTDWALNMRLLSEIRRDYNNVFPPIRKQIYKLAVEDGLFPSSPERARFDWMIPGVLLIGAAFFLPNYWPSWLDVHRFWLSVGIGASGLVLIGWARAMSRRTLRGVHLLARVRGFQEFLERAEKDRLGRMPADTLHRFLPWAIALGVSERWIFNFDGVAVAEPAWYTGSMPFSLSSYHSGLTSFGRSTTEAFTTSRTGGFASGSSGFSSGGGGGGGSSGGGGGGGGGGTF